MRLAAAIVVFAALSACAMTSSAPQGFARDDAWRQHQAKLDADIIMQGMAQARERASELARSAR
jgi:outer membrane biogenesis lipoprotein LolB